MNCNIDLKGPTQAVVAGTYYVPGVPSLNGNAEPQFTIDGRHFIDEIPREIVVANCVYEQSFVRPDGRYTYVKRNHIRFLVDDHGNVTDAENPVVDVKQIKAGDRVCCQKGIWFTVRESVLKRPENVIVFRGHDDEGRFRQTSKPRAHTQGRTINTEWPKSAILSDADRDQLIECLNANTEPNLALRNAALHYVKRTNGYDFTKK